MTRDRALCCAPEGCPHGQECVRSPYVTPVHPGGAQTWFLPLRPGHDCDDFLGPVAREPAND